MVFLVAITSGRRVSEIQNLCCDKPYIRFTASKVILMINVEFLPKVASQRHINQPLELPAMGQELIMVWASCVCGRCWRTIYKGPMSSGLPTVHNSL